MDTTKHTVTLPIADYEELIKNQKTGEEAKAAATHLYMLGRSLNLEHEGEFDINKVPVSCDVYHNMGKPHIVFKY